MYCQLLAWSGPIIQCNCYRVPVQCFGRSLFAEGGVPLYQETSSSRACSRGVSTTKVGPFRGRAAKCCAQQIRTKSAKVGDGPAGPLEGARRPLHKRSSLLRDRPSKAAKAGARRASAERTSLRGGPKAAKPKEGAALGYRRLRKMVMPHAHPHGALPAGQSC